MLGELGERDCEAYLENGVLLLRFKSVGTEQLKTTQGFVRSETVLIALKEFEDIVDDNSLQIYFFLVVEVLCLQLDLQRCVR